MYIAVACTARLLRESEARPQIYTCYKKIPRDKRICKWCNLICIRTRIIGNEWCNYELVFRLRERSQMTSSKIRVFQIPSPLRHLSSSLPYPIDDVIFYQTPLFFPRWFSAKLFKITKSWFSLNIIQNKNQSACWWLNVLECNITHFDNNYQFFFLLRKSCYLIQ